MYEALKHLHVTCVALSLAGFVMRGFRQMTDSPRAWPRLAGVLPHAIDTVLLASALAMVSYYDATPVWVWAKVAGLFCYIGLGMVALKYGRSRRVRIGAFSAALATAVWIVSVAITKSPAGFLG